MSDVYEVIERARREIETVDGLARDINRKLLATDKRFRRRVILIHRDGSFEFIDSAFLLRHTIHYRWVMVFAEHRKPVVYEADQLRYFAHAPLRTRFRGLPKAVNK